MVYNMSKKSGDSGGSSSEADKDTQKVTLIFGLADIFLDESYDFS